MVIGNTRDECVGFIYGAVDTNLTLVEYQALLGFAMGLKDLIPIDFEYPIPAHSTDLRDLASTVSTDWIMLCSNRNVTRSVAATSDNPVWYYSFNKVASFSQSVWAPDVTRTNTYSILFCRCFMPLYTISCLWLCCCIVVLPMYVSC